MHQPLGGAAPSLVQAALREGREQIRAEDLAGLFDVLAKVEDEALDGDLADGERLLWSDGRRVDEERLRCAELRRVGHDLVDVTVGDLAVALVLRVEDGDRLSGRGISQDEVDAKDVAPLRVEAGGVLAIERPAASR
jgi:hypothetical protein